MNKYKADIIVKLKNGVRDPQGSAIETVLKRVGLENNPKINVGKFFSIEIESENPETAKEKIEKIADEVLSNPILETYEIIRLEQI